MGKSSLYKWEYCKCCQRWQNHQELDDGGLMCLKCNHITPKEKRVDI